MSAKGMTVAIMASQLAEAVAKDEKPEAGGCDLSAGMYGPHASKLIREWAAVIFPDRPPEAYLVPLPGRVPDRALFLDREAALSAAARHGSVVRNLIYGD